MKLRNRSSINTHSATHSESGFTTIQLIFTVAIIGVVSSFAVIQIASARQQMRLQGVARTFAGYVEKARLDAIRRHGGDADAPPSVRFAADMRSYSVTMDFAGNGTSSTRVVPLEADVSLLSEAPEPIIFNWRGRTTLCSQTFTLRSGGKQSTIDISGSGDVTVDGDAGFLPTITHTNVNISADVVSEAVINGMSVPATVTANNCSATPTPTPTPTPPPPPPSTPTCTATVDAAPAILEIRKNGGTGSFSVTVGSATTVTAAGTSNLTISPASQPVSGTGSFTVTSNNNSRGLFLSLIHISEPTRPY